MLSEIAAWFKSNAIRYFDVDTNNVSAEKNRTFRIYQNRTLDSFINSSNQRNYQYRIFIDREYYANNDNIRIHKGGIRHTKNNSRVNYRKKKRETSRYSFFANEVRKHYNNLDKDVYQPLSTLYIREGEYDYSPFHRFRIKVNNISDNFLSDMAIKHIAIDNTNLFDAIKDYMEYLILYNRSVESAPRVIESIVKSKFIQAGIYPTDIDNYSKVGYYHFDEVITILDLIWEDFLHSDMNIQSFIKSYNFRGLKYSKYEDILKQGAFIIGKGNDIQRDNMIKVLEQIPKNRLILKAFVDLVNSKSELERRAKRVRDMAASISNLISKHEYKTLCNCCPTQDSNIWNYNSRK
jgi:hypothetical protein